MCAHMFQKTCARMPVAALIARSWDQLTCWRRSLGAWPPVDLHAALGPSEAPHSLPCPWNAGSAHRSHSGSCSKDIALNKVSLRPSGLTWLNPVKASIYIIMSVEGEEVYLPHSHPRKALDVSSPAYETCHLPTQSGLPLSLGSPCPLQAGTSLRTNTCLSTAEWINKMCVMAISCRMTQQWKWTSSTHNNMDESPTDKSTCHMASCI